MLEAYGNIWDLFKDYDAVVITTNGFVKTNGEAVMGRGIALEAKEHFDNLPERLGLAIREEGNRVFIFPHYYNRVSTKLSSVYRGFDFQNMGRVITFPVKPIMGANGKPGWSVKAEIGLIETSCKQLIELLDKTPWISKVIMPRPGCGNGGLKWEDVKPVIEPLLDDRFTVVTFHP